MPARVRRSETFVPPLARLVLAVTDWCGTAGRVNRSIVFVARRPRDVATGALSGPAPASDHATRAVSGQLPALDERYAADEDVGDAVSAHDPALRPGREVVHALRRPRADSRGIEARDVRRGAGDEAAAIGNAVDVRGHRGQPVNGLLERQEAALAHPVAEQVRRVAGVAQDGDVRARVRERDQALRLP